MADSSSPHDEQHLSVSVIEQLRRSAEGLREQVMRSRQLLDETRQTIGKMPRQRLFSDGPADAPDKAPPDR